VQQLAAPEGRVRTVEEVSRFFDRNPHFSWVNVSGGEIWTLPTRTRCSHDHRTVEDLFLLDFPDDRSADGQDRRRRWRRSSRRSCRSWLVTVSLDGPPATHDEVRGAKGAFANATATFARAAQAAVERFDVFHGVTMGGFNKGKLFETFPNAGPRRRPRRGNCASSTSTSRR